MDTTDGLDRFSVLFVCTGNICRSPIAERFFRRQFGSEEFVWSSAGTAAAVGMPMPEQAVAQVLRLGGVAEGHRAQQLTRSLVSSADLVLGMSRRHRAEATRLFPRASAKTFTLREFARLADRVDALSIDSSDDLSLRSTRRRAAVARIAAQRGQGPGPVPASDDEVPDPFRRSDADFEHAAHLIAATAQAIQAALGVSPPEDGCYQSVNFPDSRSR